MPALFDTPIHTNDQSIDRVLNAGLPVALIFQDRHGSPGLDQALERLARENASHLLIAELQQGENPEASRRFSINRTPAVVTYRDGQVLSKAEGVGAMEVEQHVAFLLGKGPRPAAASAASGAGTTGQAPAGERATRGAEGHPFAVTDATFERDVMQSTEPVLVDFWAVWCGPCRMVEPVVEKIAAELPGKLRVAKVNVDENPMISQRYGIQSIPTMMVVRNGKIVDRWVGALPEPAIRSRVAASMEKR